MKDLKFLVMSNDGKKVVAAFLRRWEAEEYITNNQNYDNLSLKVVDDQKGGD